MDFGSATYLDISNVVFLNHIDRTESSRSTGRIPNPTVALDPAPTNQRFVKILFKSVNVFDSLHIIRPFFVQLLQKLQYFNYIELVIAALEAIEEAWQQVLHPTDVTLLDRIIKFKVLQ